MKFTRYLEDTQTPEWKRAYIDYRVFKERIRAIRRVQDGLAYPTDSYSNSQLNHQDGSMLSVIVQSESGENSSGTSSVHLPVENHDLMSSARSRSQGRAEGLSRTDDLSERLPTLRRNHTSPSTPPSPGGVAATNTGRGPKITLPRLVVRQATNHSHLTLPSPGGEAATLSSRRIKNSNISRPAIARQGTNNSQTRRGDVVPPSPAVPPSSPASRVMRGLTHFIYPSRRHPYSELSLNALVPQLSPQELAFFSALDNELEKVEKFYIDREAAMKKRTRELEAQLRELNAHRKLFDAAQPEYYFSWTTIFNPRMISNSFRRRSTSAAPAYTENATDIPRISVEEVSSRLKKDEERKDEERMENERWHEHLDPKAYLNSRRKIKKAVLEHYRGLEMLHNYRVLNIYGFRRVLQKFEKATKVSTEISHVPAIFEHCDRSRPNEHTWRRRLREVHFSRTKPSGP
ncbi:SPX domain-containing protein [Mycena galericulata]|nr:SPX domain-containing protein [Mycena galericulata]